MNIYRELLTVNEYALRRMRDLILEEPAWDRTPTHYDGDVDLSSGDRRVRRRHDHWLGLVQRLS